MQVNDDGPLYSDPEWRTDLISLIFSPYYNESSFALVCDIIASMDGNRIQKGDGSIALEIQVKGQTRSVRIDEKSLYDHFIACSAPSNAVCIFLYTICLPFVHSNMATNVFVHAIRIKALNYYKITKGSDPLMASAKITLARPSGYASFEKAKAAYNKVYEKNTYKEIKQASKLITADSIGEEFISYFVDQITSAFPGKKLVHVPSRVQPSIPFTNSQERLNDSQESSPLEDRLSRPTATPPGTPTRMESKTPTEEKRTDQHLLSHTGSRKDYLSVDINASVPPPLMKQVTDHVESGGTVTVTTDITVHTDNETMKEIDFDQWGDSQLDVNAIHLSSTNAQSKNKAPSVFPTEPTQEKRIDQITKTSANIQEMPSVSPAEPTQEKRLDKTVKTSADIQEMPIKKTQERTSLANDERLMIDIFEPPVVASSHWVDKRFSMPPLIFDYPPPKLDMKTPIFQPLITKKVIPIEKTQAHKSKRDDSTLPIDGLDSSNSYACSDDWRPFISTYQDLASACDKHSDYELEKLDVARYFLLDTYSLRIHKKKNANFSNEGTYKSLDVGTFSDQSLHFLDAEKTKFSDYITFLDRFLSPSRKVNSSSSLFEMSLFVSWVYYIIRKDQTFKKRIIDQEISQDQERVFNPLINNIISSLDTCKGRDAGLDAIVYRVECFIHSSFETKNQ